MINKFIRFILLDVGLQINDFGFEIIGDNVAAQVLVTTQQQNLKKLEPELHSESLNNFFFVKYKQKLNI